MSSPTNIPDLDTANKKRVVTVEHLSDATLFGSTTVLMDIDLINLDQRNVKLSGSLYHSMSAAWFTIEPMYPFGHALMSSKASIHVSC